MALTLYNIKKWYKMLTGKSILHVNQDLGQYFSAEHIAGYYNNLTEKVLMQPELLENEKLPQYLTSDRQLVMFPVAIFQYGLGAYDLFLKTNDERYLKKFKQCAAWAIDNQMPSGAWNNFFFAYPDHPYGAMAQGEGVSLLLRMYKKENDEHWLKAAKRAIDFMLTPIEKGGTTQYIGQQPILMEYTHLPAVMNGWIFAWWGLYDYVLATDDKAHYKTLLDQSCTALEGFLPLFTTSYWSKYDTETKMASPFYHHLHIAQMQAMHQLTRHDIFADYALRWQQYENNKICKIKAFMVKAAQKIKE